MREDTTPAEAAPAPAPATARTMDMGDALAPLERLVNYRRLILRDMRAYLIEGVHYGRIKGLPQKILLKPGIDALASILRLRI